MTKKASNKAAFYILIVYDLPIRLLDLVDKIQAPTTSTPFE